MKQQWTPIPGTGTQRKYFQRLSQMRTTDKHLGRCPTSVWVKIPAQKRFFSFTAQVLSKLQCINSVPTQQKTACVRSKDTIFSLFLSSPKSLFAVSIPALKTPSPTPLTDLETYLASTCLVSSGILPLTAKHTQVGFPSVLELELNSRNSLLFSKPKILQLQAPHLLDLLGQ